MLMKTRRQRGKECLDFLLHRGLRRGLGGDVKILVMVNVNEYPIIVSIAQCGGCGG